MGDAVAPAFAFGEAAIVFESGKIGLRFHKQVPALFFGEEGSEPVNAGDFGEGEEHERAAKAVHVPVCGADAVYQGVHQHTDSLRGLIAAAQDEGEDFEGVGIAQGGIR